MNDMGMTQSANSTATPHRGHSLMATDRTEITVKGVSEVLSFDEANVRLVTVCGILNLEGEGLRIHVLSTKEGMVAVTGRLNGVLYEAEATENPSEPLGRRGRSRGRRFLG